MTPIDYIREPLFESNKKYSDPQLLNDLWEWRNTELCATVKYEVIFPMNVVANDNIIDIYSGINDCSAGIISIDKNEFYKKYQSQINI